jgi:cysteine desulfurase family protein (TIGR01976 family)
MTMVDLDLQWIRDQFPALSQEINGQPVIFFDGPGGTQVPQTVIAAISDYLLHSNANSHGTFATSERTDALIASAREAIADFLGCHSDEVVFGANMTTLTFAISRAIGRSLQPGDEILVTQLDHSANVSPWKALQEQGIIVRTVDVYLEDCTLNLESLAQHLNPRTRLVAVGYASNAVGTINDVSTIVKMAHDVGAWAFIDAVHYTPHGALDVRLLNCDFLVCSAYKFFGPHLGILYSKREFLAQLQPYKVQPAPDQVPFRWETGTQNHEGLAGLVATIAYLAELGDRTVGQAINRRHALLNAMKAIQIYEQQLSQVLIAGLLQIPGLTVYGITDPDRFWWRTPTVGIRLNGQSPYDVAQQLGDRNIFTWNGNFYALGLTQALGVESSGGLLRIGLVHYNTIAEIQHLLKSLQEIAI